MGLLVPTFLFLSLLATVSPKPGISNRANRAYSTLLDSYPIVTPPPHPAGKVISDLIGGCSCPAMKTTCDDTVIYRQNTKIHQVPGEQRTVYLKKERLREQPIREPATLDKDFADFTQLPAQIIPQPVELIKEVLREEIEYYDVIVDRIEIQYNDVTQKVYLDVEEAEIREDTVDVGVPVQLREEVLNIIDEPERVWLKEEVAQQTNETFSVTQNVYNIYPVEREKIETIQCENYRIVKVPRDDCQQPRHLDGYLPPP